MTFHLMLEKGKAEKNINHIWMQEVRSRTHHRGRLNQSVACVIFWNVIVIYCYVLQVSYSDYVLRGCPD